MILNRCGSVVWHPVIVHFVLSVPILLLLIQGLAAWRLRFTAERSSQSIAVMNRANAVGHLILLALTYAAMATGDADADRLQSLSDAHVSTYLEAHTDLAQAALLVTIISLGISIVRLKKTGRALRLLQLFVLVILIGLLLITAWRGTRLVYDTNATRVHIQKIDSSHQESPQSDDPTP